MSSACEPEGGTDPLPYGIAFGANVGGRLDNLSAARRRLLAAAHSPETARFSPVFESAPVGCPPGAPPFLNAVAEVRLPLSPPAALALCQEIESDLGRPARRAPNSPRPIDLDLLYAGGRTCTTETLQLPHPRLADRRFVLEPLAAIRPALVIPGTGRTVRGLLRDLTSDEPPLRMLADLW